MLSILGDKMGLGAPAAVEPEAPQSPEGSPKLDSSGAIVLLGTMVFVL